MKRYCSDNIECPNCGNFHHWNSGKTYVEYSLQNILISNPKIITQNGEKNVRILLYRFRGENNCRPRKLCELLYSRSEGVRFENVQDGDNLYTPDMVLGPARKGIKLTYCTDTRPTDSIRNNAKGSDLFICEGMYGEKDKLKKAKEYKHMTFYEAAQLAKEAEVAEMWLTHYSPSLTHPEEYMDEVKKIFPNSIAAKDKRTVELTFSD